MTHPIIKTDNYILITSDEEIKSLDAEWGGWWHGGKKVIAHLPLNNSPIREGVPLLPPLPNEEDDVKKLAWEEYPSKFESIEEEKSVHDINLKDRITFAKGYKKAKEKYKFTEEDMRKAKDYGNGVGEGRFLSWSKFIESLSQPKLPVGFKCEMDKTKDSVFYSNDVPYSSLLIINGVMQGEWIFE